MYARVEWDSKFFKQRKFWINFLEGIKRTHFYQMSVVFHLLLLSLPHLSSEKMLIILSVFVLVVPVSIISLLKLYKIGVAKRSNFSQLQNWTNAWSALNMHIWSILIQKQHFHSWNEEKCKMGWQNTISHESSLTDLFRACIFHFLSKIFIFDRSEKFRFWCKFFIYFLGLKQLKKSTITEKFC